MHSAFLTRSFLPRRLPTANTERPGVPIHGQTPESEQEFQPRVGFAWDITGKGKSVLRASYGMFYARQKHAQPKVGAITTNGVQQQEIVAGSCLSGPPACGFRNSAGGAPPTFPGTVPVTAQPLPLVGAGVTVFSKDYGNPRIYSTNVGYEQQLIGDYALYADFSMSKGVHLTRFINPNAGTGFTLPTSGQDTVNYVGVHNPFPNLGDITDTVSSAKSLYRGVTVGMRKRMSHRFLFDANYTYSKDYDDDSNERDPFTFRYANLFNLASEIFLLGPRRTPQVQFLFRGESSLGFRRQTFVCRPILPQPITDNVNGTGAGAPCSEQNSISRFVIPTGGGAAIDCGRNHLRKDNAFFTADFGVARPFHFGERYVLIPKMRSLQRLQQQEQRQPVSTPQLFDFNGFLRVGVGDPRQAQLSVRFEF